MKTNIYTKADMYMQADTTKTARRRVYKHVQGTGLVLLAVLVKYLAQPNEIFLAGNPFFGLLAYTPLILFFCNFCAASRVATRLGALYGLLNTLTSYFWLAHFGDFSLWTIGAVSLGYMGVYSALFRVLYQCLSIRPVMLVRPVVFACVWTSYEFFISRGYTAFPWNLAAFPFHSFLAVNQVVELAGVWILSFTVLLLQAAAACLLSRYWSRAWAGTRFGALGGTSGSRRRDWGWLLDWRSGYADFACCMCAVLLIVQFFFYGIVRIDEIESMEADVDDNPLLVLLVQQNSDSWQHDFLTPLSTAIDLSQRGISEAENIYGRRPDLVSWSETSLRFPYSENINFYAQNPEPLSFVQYLNESATDLLSGVPLYRYDAELGEAAYLNGVIHLDSSARVQNSYGKIHLIPFAEHVPLVDLPFMTHFLQDVIGLPGSGWKAGSEIMLMRLEKRNIDIGTPICFEDSFANNTRAFVRAGADILINLTNNSWSKTRSAQIQHFVAARYRAIENRRPLLRSTNGGITSVIQPTGRIQSSIPMFEAGYLLSEVHLAQNPIQTVYTRFGDWFAYLLIGATLYIAIVRYPRRCRTRLLYTSV